MHLLVGLGNPGREYARNRHNIGFMALDAIADRYRLGAGKARFQGATAEGNVGSHRVLALKPATYMNESGRSVGAALRFYKLTPADVTVIHDDIDLTPGKVRVKRGGGHGGHNGLRSIDAHIGADYRRLRLGVGHPGSSDRVTGHVLNDFSAADEWLAPTLDAVAEALPILLDGDDAAFMSKVALILNPPPKPPRAGGAAPPATDG